MTGTITFRTAEQAAIFECELKGQISDGKWWNTPGTDYREWCAAEVAVGERVGRAGFWPRKSNFALDAKDLLDVVGKRMCNYARLALAGVPLADICKLADSVCDLHGEFRGKPDFKGDHWDERRLWLDRWNLEWVEDILTDPEGYGMTDLRRDLKEMKQTIRTRAE